MNQVQTVLPTKEYTAKLVEVARAQEKKRKAAPPSKLGDVTQVRKQLMNQNTPKGMHSIFVGLSKLKSYAQDGYEPLTSDGDLIMDTFGNETEVLVACTQEKYEEGLQQVSNRSAFNLKEPPRDENGNVQHTEGVVTESIDKVAPDDPRRKAMKANPDSVFKEEKPS